MLPTYGHSSRISPVSYTHLSFSYAENQAFYVPVPADRTEAQKIVNEFRPAFEKEGALKVCLLYTSYFYIELTLTYNQVIPIYTYGKRRDYNQ